MTDRRPLVVMLAGPNGAGKSTGAERVLRGAMAVEEFVNADSIAVGLSAYRPESVAFSAGRLMIERLRALAIARRDFAFETTLAGRGHERFIAAIRASGYRAHLIFLCLPSPDLAIARVADRVRRGGHHVNDDVVRRRFRAGLQNLFGYYLGVVDSWELIDNADASDPQLIASRSLGGGDVVSDPPAWNRLKNWSP